MRVTRDYWHNSRLHDNRYLRGNINNHFIDIFRKRRKQSCNVPAKTKSSVSFSVPCGNYQNIYIIMEA